MNSKNTASNRLIAAALAVCDRWESPQWTHESAHTGELIFALREALREFNLVCFSNTHQELDSALTERMTFNDWWNEGEVSPGDNPYTHETAAYWAWEGWQAGAKAEREECARICRDLGRGHGVSFAEYDCVEAIRARGEE
jgi:hypothetical protein